MFIRFKNCAQKEANVPKKVCEEAKFPKNLEILEWLIKQEPNSAFAVSYVE